MAGKRRPLAFLVLLAITAFLVVACSTAGAPGGGATAGPAGDAQRGTFGLSAPGAVPAVGESRTGAQPGGGDGSKAQTVPVPQAFETDRKLILTANVAMRAKDPWAVADEVQRIALETDGDILALSQSGSDERRSATLTIRVPQARFNDTLRRIRDIADVDVLSSSVEGKDVTEQFVDLEARLRAKQLEEKRYLDLLLTAQKIDDILRIEQVLTQVRTQVEQLTGQLNSIRQRTTFSTISVQVSPASPVPVPTPDPRAYDPSRTLERAVAALASVLRVAVDALIWALVFGWIPLMVFGVALLVSRTRARAMPTA